MKRFMDQEMSREKESKHNPTNVVAKLMGLEALPSGEPNLFVERSHRKDNSQHMYGHSGSPFRHLQMKDRFVDKGMLHEVHPCTEQTASKDIHETWQQSQRTSHVRDKIPERGKWGEDVDEEKMAFISQKFMEAKRLSTDERLRQSKQFQDALEVLSNNSDLLLRLLDSKNPYELNFTPPAETKHIALLKPLKMVDNDKSVGKGEKNDEQAKKPANVSQISVWGNKNHGYSPAKQKVDDFPVLSTRIVVLKPSPGRSPIPSPRHMRSENFYQVPEHDDVLESRKVGKEITQKIHGSLGSHQRDQTLYNSIFSNGYYGDESFYNKSFHEYTAGNLSDLEGMSPLPRHSWDYNNHCGSPYSIQSLGRASYSPESSVCKEAKKRLHERWTMMESDNKGPQEQKHVGRSSTLSDMLSLSHIKKPVTSEIECINEDKEPSKSVSCRHSFSEEKSIDGYPKHLTRSNSVPASSAVHETGLRVEVCDHNAGKAHGSKVLRKSKSMTSSFKGKVSRFLFSRNKKSTKEKSSLSQSNDESQSCVTKTSVASVDSDGVLMDDVSQCFNGFEECSLPAQCVSLDKTSSDSVSNREQQDMIILEPGWTVSKPMVPEISIENQGQPSPVSVLEPPFEDDNAAHASLDCMKGDHLGSHVPLKSNLIDKSPPIESIARTMSWDDSCAEAASPLMVLSLDSKVEEQEWFLLLEKLLSAAGLDDQVHYDSFDTRWYSLESPLDPSLRDRYANLNDKEPQTLPESRRRKMRSNQKLVFDCVNDALLEINGNYGSEKYFKSMAYSGSHSKVPVQKGASPLLVDHIVAQMMELMANGIRSAWEDCGDSNSLLVENAVRKEVAEKKWAELMGLEIDLLGREIEGELIEVLLENAVVDFKGSSA